MTSTYRLMRCVLKLSLVLVEVRCIEACMLRLAKDAEVRGATMMVTAFSLTAAAMPACIRAQTHAQERTSARRQEFVRAERLACVRAGRQAGRHTHTHTHTHTLGSLQGMQKERSHYQCVFLVQNGVKMVG